MSRSEEHVLSKKTLRRMCCTLVENKEKLKRFPLSFLVWEEIMPKLFLLILKLFWF